MKKCSKCQSEKPLEQFSFKNKSKNTYQSTCKICSRKAIKGHYNNNRNYYLEKAKTRNRQQRKIIQNYVREYLSTHPCIDCGENDPIVLEFDHKSDKIDSVSNLIRHTHSLTRIQKEIAKCEVRCANCHRRKTAKDYSWYKQAPVV